MASILLPILPGTLPSGVCYSSEQARLNAYAEAMNAYLASGLAFYNYGDTEPSVDNRSYPWLRTTDGLWYIYLQGVWASPRPKCEQDTYYRILWAGAEANVPFKDGGSPGTVSDITGPFWEIDTLAAGRSPMAPGTIPDSDPGKVLAVGEQYGTGTIDAPLLEHTHTFKAFVGNDSSGETYITVPNNSSSQNSTYTTDASGEADAKINLTHPVYGLWILKPTARIYYTV